MPPGKEFILEMLNYMSKKDRHQQKVKAFCDIIQCLYDNDICYDEIDEVLRDVKEQCKVQRESIEYETAKDYFDDNKRCDIGYCVPKPFSDEVKKMMGVEGLS